MTFGLVFWAGSVESMRGKGIKIVVNRWRNYIFFVYLFRTKV